MRDFDIVFGNKLKDIFDEWFNELVKEGYIKDGDYQFNTTISRPLMYELAGKKLYDTKDHSRVGFNVVDKYLPGDHRYIYIYQDNPENINFVIEDCEKLYVCKKHSNWISYSWDKMHDLANRIVKELDLEFIKEAESHVIDELVSVVSKSPAKVLDDVVDFMVSKILEYNYVIFQSNFTFMGDDVPFTMVCEKGDTDSHNNTSISIQAWCQDWSSFTIDDFDNNTFLREWRCHFMDDNHPDQARLLNARQIIELPDFSDNNYTFMNGEWSFDLNDDATRSLLKNLIHTELYHEYFYDDNNGSLVKGAVAIIYNER